MKTQPTKERSATLQRLRSEVAKARVLAEYPLHPAMAASYRNSHAASVVVLQAYEACLPC